MLWYRSSLSGYAESLARYTHAESDERQARDRAYKILPPRKACLGRWLQLLVVNMTVFLGSARVRADPAACRCTAMRFGVTGAQIGLLFACFRSLLAVRRAGPGSCSDRWVAASGAAPVSDGLDAVAACDGTATDLLYTLMAARALAGLFGGSVATAQAPRRRRNHTRLNENRHMGLTGASIGSGRLWSVRRC